MPGNDKLADDLAKHLHMECGAATVRRFPDGESLVQVEALMDGRDPLFVCTLDRSDDKMVPLLLLACAGPDRTGLSSPVCVAVHVVFGLPALDALCFAGAVDMVSCDTISVTPPTGLLWP